MACCMHDHCKTEKFVSTVILTAIFFIVYACINMLHVHPEPNMGGSGAWVT